MNYFKMNPPGTICFNDVYERILRDIDANNFLDVGCGGGENSLIALQKGMKGVGIDFSPLAIQKSQELLQDYIKDGKYNLIQGNFFDTTDIGHDFDLVISFFTLEHIKDDEEFLRLLKKRVRPGGYLIFSIPARRDKWAFEDETGGHFRRYDRSDLEIILKNNTISHFEIFSLGVPLSNFLYFFSDKIERKSSEKGRINLSLDERTRISGLRDTPFKTIFPSFFKVILNKWTLFPFIMVQRFFFSSNYGLTILVYCKILEN